MGGVGFGVREQLAFELRGIRRQTCRGDGGRRKEAHLPARRPRRGRRTVTAQGRSVLPLHFILSTQQSSLSHRPVKLLTLLLSVRADTGPLCGSPAHSVSLSSPTSLFTRHPLSSIYQDSFERARPNLAYQAVSNRLFLTRALTSDLASYAHERALLEVAHVKSLQNLSFRPHSSGISTAFSAVEGLGLDRRDEDRSTRSVECCEGPVGGRSYRDGEGARSMDEEGCRRGCEATTAELGLARVGEMAPSESTIGSAVKE